MVDPKEIPDAWPPPDEGAVVPMFPLQGLFLFPRQLLPLHIFEPRYKKMIEDSLDGPGRLVIGTVLEGEQESPGNVPSVLPVAGIGEIARHDKLEDGRFMVLIFGLGRVHLDEISSDEPYRLVKATRLEEAEAAGATEKRLLEALKAAVAERSSSEDETFPDLPLAVATDLLAVRLKVPQLVMQEIFAEADVARRAELALAAHAKYPGS